MVQIRKKQVEKLEEAAAKGSTFGGFKKMKTASKIALVILVFVVLASVLANVIAPHNPLEIFNARQAPGNGFIFGTDDKGRDILSRMLHGGQYSLVIGFGATGMALLCGSIIGAIAAVSRKAVSEVIMRVLDIIMSFPGIALAAVFVSILGNSVPSIIFAIGFMYTPQIARIVRANIVSEYGEDYVRATIVSGARAPWILWKHVLRNCIAPIMVFTVTLVADAIIFEASLTFIGAGIAEPTPTWGNILADARAGVLAGQINPVFVGSAYKNKGIQELLDAVIDFLPSPLDVPEIDGVTPKGDEAVRHADVKEPFSALAFKIMTDPYVGKLTYIRVYSGQAEAGSYVYNSVKDNRERFGRILEMNANDRVDRDECSAGDIVACVGLKNTTTGDTLCDEKNPIILESISFADPVIDVAVEPKTKAEQEKMSIGLSKLAEEDPTFQVHTDHETGQTIIAGMGELHLEIIVDRLRREFKVDCNVGKPQVAYRETAGKAVSHAEGKFVRQSGGKGQYGHAVIDLEPQEEGKGYEFVNAIVGGVIPKEYIPSIDKGIREALENGVIAGYPVVDIKVTLVDGSYHEVDSSEAAFKIAGSMAIKDALKKSNPVLLEPVESVEVETPEQYMGDVMGNLSSRRGKIEGMDDRMDAKVIRAKVPLGEMFGYATDLRSQTQGRASYTMQFDSYEPVPNAVREEIVAKNGGSAS